MNSYIGKNSKYCEINFIIFIRYNNNSHEKTYKKIRSLNKHLNISNEEKMLCNLRFLL